jgi:hypothetical protein
MAQLGFYDYLVVEGVRESNPVGRGRYTQRGGFGGRQGLLPRMTRLPWIPGEQQWLDILEVARREPVRNRLMLALAATRLTATSDAASADHPASSG